MIQRHAFPGRIGAHAVFPDLRPPGASLPRPSEPSADRSVPRARDADFSHLPVEMIERITCELNDDKDIVYFSATERHIRRCLGAVLDTIDLGRAISRIRSGSVLANAMDDIGKTPRFRRPALWQTALDQIAVLMPAETAVAHEYAQDILWTAANDCAPALRPSRLTRMFDMLGGALCHLTAADQCRQSLRMLKRWAPVYSEEQAKGEYTPSRMLFDVDRATLSTRHLEYLEEISLFPAGQQYAMVRALPAPALIRLPLRERRPAFMHLLNTCLSLQPGARDAMLARLQWEIYDLAPTDIDSARELIDRQMPDITRCKPGRARRLSGWRMGDKVFDQTL